MANNNTMVERAVAILEYLYTADKPIGVSKIASDLTLPKATVFRILATLEKTHIVEKEYNTDDYKLGITLIRYGAKASSNLSLVEITKPFIDDLSHLIEESVNLNVEHLGYSLNIYKSDGAVSSLVTNLVAISPLNCSATGKIFLSTRSEKSLVDYFASTCNQAEKRTVNSIMTKQDYLVERDKLKKSGYLYDDEEYDYGLFCVAMPIMYQSRIIAALSVTGPKTRLELKGLNIIIEELKKTCQAIMCIIDDLDPASSYQLNRFLY